MSNNYVCPQCKHFSLIRLLNYNVDPPQRSDLWRCINCRMSGQLIFIFTTEQVTGGIEEMKKVEFTWTHENTIIDLKFIVQPQRGWFEQNIKPITELLKKQIPATSREWNSNTQKWSIAAEYWNPSKRLLELSGFTLVETKWTDPSAIPGVHVPKEYAESFHYNTEPITTKESAASIAKQLSVFLGVEITTQDLKDLKKLYRSKAREYHPDFGGDASKMSELNRLWTLYTNTGETQ